MVSQYPDTIEIEVPATASQDADGNWIAAGSPVTTSFKGRSEPVSQTKSAYIEGTDGNKIQIKSIVYCPVATPLVKEGTKVTVTNKLGVVVVTGPCLQFSRGQLNARIWL